MRLVATNVRLEPQDYRDLSTLAQARGESIAQAVRTAVDAYLRGWRGEAAESAPAFNESSTRGRRQPSDHLALARVRGGELVLPAPSAYPNGTEVLVHVLGPATPSDLEAVAARRAVLAAIADELASLPDAPTPVSDEDRDIYR